MKKEELLTINLLDLSKTDYSLLFKGTNYPWEAIPRINSMFRELTSRLGPDYNRIKDGVYVHKSVTVLKSVYLGRNIIIGRDADIRNSAFIRENVIIGDDCVLGNSCEAKNVIMFNNSQAPHFNYLGDCILGYKAHIGAGVVMSNLKLDKNLINVTCEDGKIETGLKKFGGVIGDNAEVGCNSVINPGTIIGRGSLVYPLSNVRGCINPNTIYKSETEQINRN